MQAKQYLLCFALVASSVVFVQAGTASKVAASEAAAAASVKDEARSGGWGATSYPTGYSFSHGLTSYGLPLILIPLIYFGFLWCIVLFGISAFSGAPSHHGGHGNAGGWGWRASNGGGGGHGQGRYRRQDFEDEYYNTQQRVMNSFQ